TGGTIAGALPLLAGGRDAGRGTGGTTDRGSESGAATSRKCVSTLGRSTAGLAWAGSASTARRTADAAIGSRPRMGLRVCFMRGLVGSARGVNAAPLRPALHTGLQRVT